MHYRKTTTNILDPALGHINSNKTMECGILSKTGALEAVSCGLPSLGGLCQFDGMHYFNKYFYLRKAHTCIQYII